MPAAPQGKRRPYDRPLALRSGKIVFSRPARAPSSNWLRIHARMEGRREELGSLEFSFSPINDEVSLHNFVVKGRRGIRDGSSSGLGTLLLKELLDRLDEINSFRGGGKPISRLTLVAAPHLLSEEKRHPFGFYSKLGFRPLGISKIEASKRVFLGEAVQMTAGIEDLRAALSARLAKKAMNQEVL